MLCRELGQAQLYIGQNSLYALMRNLSGWVGDRAGGCCYVEVFHHRTLSKPHRKNW